MTGSLSLTLSQRERGQIELTLFAFSLWERTGERGYFRHKSDNKDL